MFDMNSMLLGAAISGGFLAVTMLSFWSIQKGAGFKLTWAIGILVMVVHVLAYWFFARDRIPAVGALACAALPVGAAFVYLAARQFMEDEIHAPRLLLRLALPYLAVAMPLFLLGYDGIALIVQNAWTALLLALAGLTYLRAYREVPFTIAAIFGLHTVAAASFLLCGIVLVVEGSWSIGYPPQNWAEEINVVIAVLAITGVGALTLSIDQARLANRDRMSAMTDPLSGLLNRRGLAAAFPRPIGSGTAIVLFDLDHFKRVNDRYGHAVGDEVILRFARTLREHGRAADRMVRIGGEEFLMIMEGITPRQARKVAERIAAAFADGRTRSRDGELFRCTVSAGVAFGDAAGASLDEVMLRADRALYVAKQEGRNRVETGEWRLAG